MGGTHTRTLNTHRPTHPGPNARWPHRSSAATLPTTSSRRDREEISTVCPYRSDRPRWCSRGGTVGHGPVRTADHRQDSLLWRAAATKPHAEGHAHPCITAKQQGRAGAPVDTNVQCPVPSAQCPVASGQCPVLSAQCPVQLHLQCPVPTTTPHPHLIPSPPPRRPNVSTARRGLTTDCDAAAGQAFPQQQHSALPPPA